MKFNCGPTWEEKKLAKEKPHAWFAWFPVRIGSRDCRWLEDVLRTGTFHSSWTDTYWTYEYSALPKVRFEGE